MSRYDDVQAEMLAEPRRWLVTGAAGFIGANLTRTLLSLNQDVVGLDNFATGHKHNIDLVRSQVTAEQAERYTFIEGDIVDPEDCKRACEGVHYVLHQAALGSVPRSIEDPMSSHQANITGFLNILMAARDAGALRFVYASSSSVYGDEPTLPKVEDRLGRVLSPYAATKIANEHYAHAFNASYGLGCIGLRYFNVFGAMQDPKGAYAAVMPRWIDTLLNGETCLIFGDGETSRDFCFIDNVVQANILAARSTEAGVKGAVYNVAYGDRTTLTELYGMIRDSLSAVKPELAGKAVVYEDERVGDIKHSLADISRSVELLGYAPTHSVERGLAEAIDWYVADHARRTGSA